MTELKCPFCQQKLDTGNYYVHCHNPGCNTTAEMEGTEEMWAALILAHNALIVALKGLDDIIDSGSDGYWTAIKTKEQIMALKQKEQKNGQTERSDSTN